MNNIGKTIKKLRTEKNITQEQLAEKLYAIRQALLRNRLKATHIVCLFTPYLRQKASEYLDIHTFFSLL